MPVFDSLNPFLPWYINFTTPTDYPNHKTIRAHPCRQLYAAAKVEFVNRLLQTIADVSKSKPMPDCSV